MKRTSWRIAVACCIACSFSSANLFARGFAGGAGISKGGGGGGHQGGGGFAPAISRTPAFSQPNFSARTAGGVPHAERHSFKGIYPATGIHAGTAIGVRQTGGATFGTQHLVGGAAGAIVYPGAAAGASRHFDGGNFARITSRPYAGNSLNFGNHSVNLAQSGYRPAFYGHGLYHGYWNGNYGFGGGYGGGWSGGYGTGWGYGRGLGSGLGIGYGLVPLGWGYGGWGLGSMAYNSGYLGYSNPYYNGSFGGYNYTQPIPVDYGVSPTAVDAEENPADAALNAAVAAFKQNDYGAALDIINKGIAQYPTDSVLHEFRGLVLFARGDFQQAAATIHSVLAVGPGWDWTTLASLYANVAIYADQLRALESYVRANPQDGASRFLLGYHYMTGGHTDAAARQFQTVVTLVPGDRVASDIRKMILAPETEAGQQPAPQPAVDTQPAANPAATPVDPAMLAGTWKAAREDGSHFELILSKEATFTWKFSSKQQPAQELSGTYTVEGNVLALERKDGGSLIGEVTPGGAMKFNFRLVGAPLEDMGLDFSR